MKTLPMATLALALTCTTSQAAADFCISAGARTFVGKRFKVPKAGKCQPWHGFVDSISRSSGSACAKSDGTTLLISVTTQWITQTFGYGVLFDMFYFPLPIIGSAANGSYNESQQNIGSGLVQTTTPGQDNANVIPCTPTIVPIP